MFGEAAMAEPWGGMVQLRRLQPIWHKRGFWVGTMFTLAVKPQWVCYKLDKIIEQCCSNFLAHTLEVCNDAHRYNEYLAIQG
jgi:hypothetical protein